MNKNLIKEEIERISEIMGIKSNNLLIESSIYKRIGSLFGDDAAISVGKRLGRETALTLDELVGKLTNNLEEIGGQKFIKSASGSKLLLSNFEKFLKKSSNGLYDAAEFEARLDALPRFLEDGTEFRGKIKKMFAPEGTYYKTPSVKPKVDLEPVVVTSHSAGGNLENKLKSLSNKINTYKIIKN